MYIFKYIVIVNSYIKHIITHTSKILITNIKIAVSHSLKYNIQMITVLGNTLKQGSQRSLYLLEIHILPL